MPQVRRIKCNDVAGNEFAPSEMYRIILTQDETNTMERASALWNLEQKLTLQKIFNASFRLLAEILI